MSTAKNKTEISDKISIVDFAYAAGQSATSQLSESEQKRLGQFMMPTRIALAMAQAAVKDIQSDVVKILEPVGGSGVLAAAAVEFYISGEIKRQEYAKNGVSCDGDNGMPAKPYYSQNGQPKRGGWMDMTVLRGMIWCGNLGVSSLCLHKNLLTAPLP